MKITYSGELEIDWIRGVIYFHSLQTGTTILRICNLPKLITPPVNHELLDIRHMESASWSTGVGLPRVEESMEVLTHGLKQILDEWIPKLNSACDELEKVKEILNAGKHES